MLANRHRAENTGVFWAKMLTAMSTIISRALSAWHCNVAAVLGDTVHVTMTRRRRLRPILRMALAVTLARRRGRGMASATSIWLDDGSAPRHVPMGIRAIFRRVEAGGEAVGRLCRRDLR